MAGIKVTALPPSGALEKLDITYLVDVSDDGESPEGTSKQATIQNVIDAVDQLAITDVDGQAIIIAEDSSAIKVTSDNPIFRGLYYRNDFSANYVPLSLIARQDAPKIFALSGKPSNTATIPSNYGDIYVNTLNGEAYYSNGITTFNDWALISINETVGSYYNPTQFTPVLANPISFGKFFVSRNGKIINAKGIVSITFGGAFGHSVVFQFSIPYAGVASISELVGGVSGFGFTTINHKINHTELKGGINLSTTECAELSIEVDNSLSGACSFTLDFTYELS
jgi:hypothetical protein